MSNQSSVRHNESSQRFELELDGGKLAFISYAALPDQVLDLNHTEVPSEFEGQGVGRNLVKGSLDIARSDDLKVVPTCPFVARFIERNPEYKDLVAGN